MNRTKVKQRQSELFPGVRSEAGESYIGPEAMLPEICLNVRAALNGSSDPWKPESIKETLVFLQNVIKTWDHETEDLIDAAVYFMVVATIKYIKSMPKV